MIIGLDYDGTYTRDPAFFNKFIELSMSHGHSVVCVTMRSPTEQIVMPCAVYYTSRVAKQPFMQSKGISVDFWIDDMPFFIYDNASFNT